MASGSAARVGAQYPSAIPRSANGTVPRRRATASPSQPPDGSAARAVTATRSDDEQAGGGHGETRTPRAAAPRAERRVRPAACAGRPPTARRGRRRFPTPNWKNATPITAKPGERRHPRVAADVRPRRDEEEEEHGRAGAASGPRRPGSAAARASSPARAGAPASSASLLEAIASSSVSGRTSRPSSGTPSRTSRSTASPPSRHEQLYVLALAHRSYDFEASRSCEANQGQPGGGLELGDRRVGDDRAALDQDDPLGERLGLLELVGREQERAAVAGVGADRRPRPRSRASRSSAGRRLVEHDELAGSRRTRARRRARRRSPPERPPVCRADERPELEALDERRRRASGRA